MAGIDSDLIRGHIDTIILKSLFYGDKYGLEIIQEIETKSNGTYELKQPTLYSCLKRLESQGLISSYWKDSEIGGKRHYYKLTELGLETYQNNQKEWLRSREIIDNLIYNTSIDYQKTQEDILTDNSKQANDTNEPVLEQIVETESDKISQDAPLIESEIIDDSITENNAAEVFAQENTDATDELSEKIENQTNDNSADVLLDEDSITPTLNQNQELSEESEDIVTYENNLLEDNLSTSPDFEENSTEDAVAYNAGDIEENSTEDAVAYNAGDIEDNSQEHLGIIPDDNADKTDYIIEQNSQTTSYAEQDEDFLEDFDTYTPTIKKGSNYFDDKNKTEDDEELDFIDNKNSLSDDLNTINVAGEDQDSTGSVYNLNDTLSEPEQTEDLIKLNLDQIIDEESAEDNIHTGDVSENFAEQTNLAVSHCSNDILDSADTNNKELEISNEETTLEDGLSLQNDLDNEIYVFEDQTTPLNEDDEIYEPEENIAPPVTSPTYINFAKNDNIEEVDLLNTSIQDNQENSNNDQSQTLELFPSSFEEQTADENDVEKEHTIVDTANSINDYYNSSASTKNENKHYNTAGLFKQTENYQNLQAGYTDETYKQMLNELEAYSTTKPEAKPSATKEKTIVSIHQLVDDFQEQGISVRVHKKQEKESDDSKIYVKTNEIHLVKNCITFGIVGCMMLILFGIMNIFKESYTFNFKFWPFLVTIACTMAIPAINAIKYALNPYKKVTAKYAPRLSILISILITIQLILIIYCINLQLGFYSFSQENYNHLLWVIPLVLSIIPIIQSLVYFFLFNSKKYHI